MQVEVLLDDVACHVGQRPANRGETSRKLLAHHRALSGPDGHLRRPIVIVEASTRRNSVHCFLVHRLPAQLDMADGWREARNREYGRHCRDASELVSVRQRRERRAIRQETTCAAVHDKGGKDVVDGHVEDVGCWHAKNSAHVAVVAQSGAEQQVDDPGVRYHDALGLPSAPRRVHDVCQGFGRRRLHGRRSLLQASSVVQRQHRTIKPSKISEMHRLCHELPARPVFHHKAPPLRRPLWVEWQVCAARLQRTKHADHLLE